MSRIRSLLGLNTKASFSNLSAELRKKTYLSEPEFAFQDYEPQVVNTAGSATYTITNIKHARYLAIGNLVFLNYSIVGTTSGAPGFTIRLTVPFTAYTPNLNGPVGTLISDKQGGPCAILDGTERRAYWNIAHGANFIEIFKFDVSNWGIGTDRLIQFNITYERV